MSSPIKDNSILEFRYNRFADLFYYLLAHLHIENAADMYDPAFILLMSSRLGYSPDIPRDLPIYYDENFDRLSVVNFIPLSVENREACRKEIASCGFLTEDDLQLFVDPLLRLCDEAFEKFNAWWDQKRLETAKTEEYAQRRMLMFKHRFKLFFNHPELKNMRIIFSYTLTRNGRAYVDSRTEVVYLRLPEKDRDFLPCLFQFLHECTHRITDPLLKKNILMSDGTHDIAEYQVLCFDEYMIDALCPDLSKAYRAWAGEATLAFVHKNLGEEGEKPLKKKLKKMKILK